jgi:cytosine/adenosine deaminase-related metal-dependent hydrolase
MDLGRSDGGLPPDEVVEDRDAVLAACEAAIDRFDDPSPGAMVRVALAPCSPFSVTRGLMADAAGLARRRGVRLHTHLAETLDEEAFCREQFGMRPVDYLDDLGWLGDDVWLAHCVHLSDAEVARFGATGTGVAHCPGSNARLGAGIAPVAALTAAGAPVGLGVDGAASNEAGELAAEVRQALLAARLRGGPAALTARDALALGTIEGARCLGRDDELGSLEPGKLADVALWRIDGLAHAGIADPVAALVLGPPRPVDTLLVGGRAVVEGGELRTASEHEITTDIARASRRLAGTVEATL